MRTWLNTKCDNSEGNECVCPRCRFKRSLAEGELLTHEIMIERIGILSDWDHRTDVIEANMRKRFPNGKS